MTLFLYICCLFCVEMELLHACRLCGINNAFERATNVERALSILNALPTMQDIHVRDSEQRTALWHACDVGCVVLVERLLLAGGSWEDTDSSGWNTLHVCSDRGFAFILTKLLNHYQHANVTRPNRHYLHNLLSSRTSGPLWTPLHLASSSGHSKCVELLLASGANVEDSTEDGWTALLLASGASGNVKVVQLLLSYSANADVIDPVDGESCLHKACRSGSEDVAELLLSSGATIKLDAAGVTPLCHALARGFDWNITVNRRNRHNVIHVEDKDGEKT